MAAFRISEPLEGRFVMPENTETAETETAAETTEEVEETAAEGTEAQSTEESTGEAQEAAPEEKPFDRAQAEAKIRKANSEAQNLRKRLKELEPQAAELQRIKDAEKSDTERLTDQLAAANDRIAKTRLRLVKSQVQGLAAATFADPEDAVTALELGSYIDDEGDIDEAAIEADLADLLARKPHWARPQQAQPQEGARRPAPDRTQASGANKTRPANPADEFSGWLKAQLK